MNKRYVVFVSKVETPCKTEKTMDLRIVLCRSEVPQAFYASGKNGNISLYLGRIRCLRTVIQRL